MEDLQRDIRDVGKR